MSGQLTPPIAAPLATEPHGRPTQAAEISRGECAPTLRPYQREALAAIQRELAAHRSTLVELPTGTGKTVVFAADARDVAMSGGRTLVLVHREELRKQAQAKCTAAGLYTEAEQGKLRASLHARVVVASVQTLAREARLHRFPRDHFARVVVDECHHVVSDSYGVILDYFETAKVLGVTATPKRADGVALGEVLETVAYRLDLRQAIRDGWLASIVARRVVLDGVDLSRIKTRAGDLAQDELAEIMAQERAIRGVVEPLLDLAGARKTVVFGVDVAHAQRLAEELNRRLPGSARAVSGETGEDEREELLAAFSRGEFQFLCNCALLVEGWDEPSVECVAIARPTKSVGLYVQMVGRGTRLYPGKRNMLLLAFGASAGKHRLVSPVDCLVGDLPDDLRAELDLLLGRAARPLEAVIAEATGTVTQRRVEIAGEAVVRWHAEHVDPFFGQGELDDAAPPGWSEALATAKQRAQLAAEGVTVAKLPPRFSMADAARLLERIAGRRQAGLCSLKAARMIARAGIDTRALSHQRAQQLLQQLRMAGWQPAALYAEPEANTPEALERRRAQMAASRARKARAA